MTRIGETFEQELNNVELGGITGAGTPTSVSTTSSAACVGWGAAISGTITAISVISVISYTLLK